MMASDVGEWLEEVDASDRVIGRRLRSEIHRLKLMHRSTHVLVFDEQRRLLLQRRALTKDVHGGYWDTSAAGHVDPGESYRVCARRELSEELGINLVAADLRYLFRMSASESTGWEFVQVYRVDHEGPLHPNADEIAEVRWMSPAAIDAWDSAQGHLTDTFQQIWRKLRA